ncbi:MAG: penicillin-binding protein 2 [Magnetococcales bacterium]|nr:penicillin-binding protein 2 [Magnetococcales bacterium]
MSPPPSKSGGKSPLEWLRRMEKSSGTAAPSRGGLTFLQRLRSGTRGEGGTARVSGGPPGGSRRIPPISLNTGKGRLELVAVFFITGFVILAVRAADLAILQGDMLRHRAQEQRQKKIPIPADRGRFLDRQGRPLAITLPVMTLSVDADRLDDPARLAKLLAPLTGQPRDQLTHKLHKAKPGSFPVIARKVSPDRVEKIKALKEESIYFLPDVQRFYPYGETASHLLGFTDMEGKGVEGLERALDSALQGQAGVRLITRDRLGRPMPEARVLEPPHPGQDVVLTIDGAVQYIAYRALLRGVTNNRAKAGIVIIMDPNNGHILALSSQPGFNPNNIGDSPAEARRNRAVTDTYEPGSTFKIFTVGAALDAGLIKPETSLFCENGRWQVGRRTIRDHTRHGMMSVTQILQKSSNICSAKIGLKMGRSKQEEYLKALGFGRPTGIEGYHEASGRIPDITHFEELGVANRSFGQGVAVTAMQIAAATTAMVNGGLYYKPRLVAGRMVNGNLIPEPQAEPTRVIRPETSRMMREILTTVVSPEGTANDAKVEGYSVAGKTGTAQKASPTGGYDANLFFSSFVGFVPADKPKVVIYVAIDEPHGTHYGGLVAAPVFREIAEETLPLLTVPPAQPTLLKLPPPLPEPQPGADGVSGLSLAAAVEKMGDQGPPLQVRGSGVVISRENLPDGSRLNLAPLEAMAPLAAAAPGKPAPSPVKGG